LEEVKNCVGYNVTIKDINSITKLWDSAGDSNALNVVHSAIQCVLWLTRNDMCFKRSLWCGMQVVWRKSAYILAQWSILLSGSEKEKLNGVVANLESLVRAPPLLLWLEPG
jgi:hypothetical protein